MHTCAFFKGSRNDVLKRGTNPDLDLDRSFSDQLTSLVQMSLQPAQYKDRTRKIDFTRLHTVVV